MSPVIKKIDFEKDSLGKYSLEKLEKSWGNVIVSRGVKEGRCSIVVDDQTKKNCLQISYEKNKVGLKNGGAAWRTNLGHSFDEIFIQYKVKFLSDFNFVLGGKLPGIGGGSLPTGGMVADEKGFTVRAMWFGNDGGAVQYVYYMDKGLEKKWGERTSWMKNGESLCFKPGKWHTVKMRVKMNSSDKKDGIIQSWLDGDMVMNQKRRFRNDDKMGTDTFIFTTFFGGNTPDWASTKEEKIRFSDFIISSEDIV
jgi:hypothetical protein